MSARLLLTGLSASAAIYSLEPLLDLGALAQRVE